MFFPDLTDVRALRAPNVWSRCPVLEAVFRASSPSATSPADAGFVVRLSELTSSLGSLAAPALTALAEWTSTGDGRSLALAIARLALAIEIASTCKGSSCSVSPASETGSFLLAVEMEGIEDEDISRQCLAAAHAACRAAAEDTPYDFGAELERLKELGGDILLGPNTRAIADAARRRGIPVRRLDRGSLLQLGHGIHQRRMCGAETDRTSSIGEDIGWEKPLSKELLTAVGIPTPEGRIVADADDAWKAACEAGGLVVVKPQSANHGRSVFIGLTKREDIAAAYASARETGQGPNVLVERCILGAEHRVLVVDGRVAAATRGDPLYITGDGVRSIEQFVAELNTDPRRSEDADSPLYAVEFDEMTLGVLARQGYEPASIPGGGERVLIQRNGNLAVDVTDLVHPDNAALVALAARAIGLDVAGVDLVVEDISKPMRAQGGAILEVNAMPGLMMHLKPGAGQPQPVGDIIVASVIPPGTDGRIPIVAVNGNGAAAISREIGAVLTAQGLCTGVACSEGTFVDGEQTRRAGGTSRHAADLLMHPLLEAAVAEVSDEAIITEGLGFEQCQIAIFTSPGSEELTPAKRVLVESVVDGGAAVISAALPWADELAGRCRGEVVLFGANVQKDAKNWQKTVVFASNNAVFAMSAGREECIGDVDPALAQDEIDQRLAVSAAGWILRRMTKPPVHP
jgi:cyanophycin synthetase